MPIIERSSSSARLRGISCTQIGKRQFFPPARTDSGNASSFLRASYSAAVLIPEIFLMGPHK